MGYGRVAAGELPAEVLHAGSREFLVREGLPAAGAFLDFGRLGAGPLEPLDRLDPLHGIPEAGRLFVLGETEYCAHFASSGNPVLLDGVTGEVFLAKVVGGRLERDVLASDLPALAALVREVERVAEDARRLDARDGRRGPAVMAEVMLTADRRLRELDPGLFGRPDVPPAHWGTALLVRALGWGALPGGPDGPAYEIGAELVAEIATLSDEGLVRRYRPEELPPGLRHEPTRRLLTEIGLPLGGAMFGVSEEPLVTMAEAYPEYFDGEEERPYQRDFLALGHWPTDLTIALDGVTGRLELPDWYDDGHPEAYLNRDLSALLYALWTYERLRAEWERWDYGLGRDTWAVFDPQSLLSTAVDGVVEAVDPEAFATPGRSWRLLAEDGHMGGLLG
ncbi:SUKH-4 family immunity protein [Kitasatospora aureofaciens]|uniref:SUKH-4 family immunity protein n=1 Tax=Kitasatospora aureofaciens TaxID=1894 RepID=UPI001C4676A4|nr:SUKH-4 family immunity protein [Kitasatospora aureofaciens]